MVKQQFLHQLEVAFQNNFRQNHSSARVRQPEVVQFHSEQLPPESQFGRLAYKIHRQPQCNAIDAVM